MSEFVSNVDRNIKRVSVRTRHGVDIARKMAQLSLVEKGIKPGEMLTSIIFFVDEEPAERWYVFSW